MERKKEKDAQSQIHGTAERSFSGVCGSCFRDGSAGDRATPPAQICSPAF